MLLWKEEGWSWGLDGLVLVVRLGARERCRSEGKVVDVG